MGTASNVTVRGCHTQWLLPVTFLPRGWFDATRAQCSLLLRAAGASSTDAALTLPAEWETLKMLTVGQCARGLHSKEVRAVRPRGE